ncbi:MAG: DoxX family protein [Candidatus Wallbacteria bacterium HGW-Wallbacteria-1]|uniref:DoxX family protein n=1 Tax=Candidatus Wallbacteria bacterium HGW-Wallbacteria-1 TaxID=2013854 RepID=A0A2N1PL09_9BACT|nr:MAG: DoxX family protein [Candidatus Wallbacteria bacterium HGW-Wallbacteria-1]
MSDSEKGSCLRKILFGGCERNDIGLLLLRIFVGVAFMIHGWPKISGGMEGWTKIGGAMAGFGITFAPAFWGFMAAFTEFCGGLFLVLGLFTRPFSGLIAFTMVVAVFSVHGGQPFKNRELALVYLFCAIMFMIRGGGRFSIDRFIYPDPKNTETN